MFAVTVAIGWKDIITLATFLGAVAGMGWWLGRQFGGVREVLIRIEEREKHTTQRLDQTETKQAGLQEDVSDLRERLAAVESRRAGMESRRAAPNH